MSHLPTLDDVRRQASNGNLIPIYRILYSDTLTPVTAFCRAGWNNRAFLFESVVGGERVGRYSFLGGDPFLELEAFGQELVLTAEGRSEQRTVNDPLAELEQLLSRYRSVHLPGMPRFLGGAVGYAGYDVVRYTENLPNPPQDDRHVPDLSFGFYDRMVVFDHIRKAVFVVAHARMDTGDIEGEYQLACQRVDELVNRLQCQPDSLHMPDVPPAIPRSDWTSNFSQSAYEEAVRTCKEYIAAGDIFQVVLSQRLKLTTTASDLAIYRALRVVNPSPFMFLLRTPNNTLVGSSPEILVRVEDGTATIRPLAGTRKRGATESEDRALADELLSDPKERAEHVMLVDLARNDVGRVARFGSVEISDVMVVERYSHVMHITSNVTGKLRQGLSALDALRSGLPAGTVSGAPKVRAMEIIDELEPHRRGPYAGAVGYLDFTGNMDTCIALRTLVMQGQTVYVQAGAGLVADSIPDLEYQETLNKAQGLLKAIAVAELAEQSNSKVERHATGMPL